MYHYAANNPIKYTDPDGREVDIIFEITDYEKTHDGYTAFGKLTVTDQDTNESVIVNAYSGGRGRASDGVSLPIPLGEYEVLEPTKIGYRLEAIDSNKGNDIIDGTKPEQGNVRLHRPGSGLSYGCIGVATQEEWEQVKDMISNTRKSVSKVDKWRGLSSTTVVKYGNLVVRQSREFMYKQQYAPDKYKKSYIQQSMKR